MLAEYRAGLYPGYFLIVAIHDLMICVHHISTLLILSPEKFHRKAELFAIVLKLCKYPT